MHPEIDTTKALLNALEDGKPFSESTVLTCMLEMNESLGTIEKPEVTAKWASYYWSKYQKIGEQELKSVATDEKSLLILCIDIFVNKHLTSAYFGHLLAGPTTASK